MNWATIFQYAPKLALALLIIIGALIVVEIVNMIREKQPKPKETNATAHPENLQPIKFDEQPAPDTASLSMHSRTKLFIPILLLSLLTIVIIAVTMLKRQPEEPPAQLAETPTPEPTQTELPTIASPAPSASPSILMSPPESSPSSIVAPPTIKVYQIDQKKAWVQLSDDDLARLKPRDEIFIAIATIKTYTKALFKINGEEILYVKDKQLTPNKEGYIRYTLPTTETKFTIEVMLLNE